MDCVTLKIQIVLCVEKLHSVQKMKVDSDLSLYPVKPFTDFSPAATVMPQNRGSWAFVEQDKPTGPKDKRIDSLHRHEQVC